MRFTICATLSLALAAPLAAQEFSADRVRADVEFLADDVLEGRNAGTRGYDLAAHYVASRFQALGLKPAGPDGWYQPIGFARARIADEAPSGITIGGKRYANGGDVAMAGYARELGQRIEGEAVFVGYGLDAPRHGFDDYSGLDLRGKVAVMLTGMPERGTPSDVAAHLLSQKARMAERRGAIGIITIPTYVSLARLPWARTQAQARTSRYVWIDTDGRPWSSVPGIRITAQADGAAAQALFAGARLSLKRVQDEAAKGAMPRGFPLKGRVALERHSVSERMDSANVVGMIAGSDPALAGETVMMTAHLDHDGVDLNGTGDRIYNGAMDNAAGIATMLEVARAFVESGKRPRRTVIFAAVTAEEDGLLGSQYLARHPLIPAGGKLVGVVNLDMPVLTYDFSDVIAFGGEHSTLGLIAARALASADVKLSSDPMPEERVFTRSDHYSFVMEGVPSIMLATGFAGEGRDKFTGFLKDRYHKPSDDLSQAFNWQAGAKFARINYLIASGIADGRNTPRWYAGNFFGDTFAEGAPKATRGK